MVRRVPKTTRISRKPVSKSAFFLALGIVFGQILRFLTRRSNGFFLAFIPSSYSTTTIAQVSKPFSKDLLPRICTVKELATVKKQLPPLRCESTAAEPWRNDCSFSFASRCPDPVWLSQFYSEASIPFSPLMAIYVGCNKAMDAVNTLRMLSRNASFDRNLWRTSLLGNNMDHEAGRCGQEFGEQFSIPQDSQNVHDAVVHCIEAMPSTAQHLMSTAQQLHWSEKHLTISNIAVSDTDGSTYFPNLVGKVGVENMGIENCDKPRHRKNNNCVKVPLHRLDTYMSNTTFWMNEKQLVDFLSIDVEGFDFEVLLGAPKVLERTKYIEFEYNWKGNWKKHKLSSAIDMLKNKDFACYWSGSFGHIWRITNCWMDYFDLKFWSNVACVNVRLAPVLSTSMEDQFQRTLQAGDYINYSNSATANTDGGYHEANVIKQKLRNEGDFSSSNVLFSLYCALFM